MSIVFPDIGREQLLLEQWNNDAQTSWDIRLFVNDKTPAAADILTDYTEMSTLSYAEIEVVIPTDFTVSLAGGIAKVVIGQLEFTFTVGTEVSVYGWYMVSTDGGGEHLIMADRFSNAIAVSQNGDIIRIDTEFQLDYT